MSFLNALLGRSKPIRPDLDQLFGLPSAAITLQAAIGFTPTGLGSVCFASIEGGATVPAVSGRVGLSPLQVKQVTGSGQGA